MELKTVLAGIEYELVRGNLKQEISNISYDSRKVRPGGLFICIKGFQTDGHSFINSAIDNGAVAILAIDEVVIENSEVTILRTDDTRMALSKLAANYYNHPSEKLCLVGVTGTNGKTTITHLIQAILQEAGKKAGIIGTLYAKIGAQEKDLKHTTPEAPEIEEFISLAVEEQADYVVMEVSSHALDLHRTDNLDYNVAIFSNLSQDHLDYHHNMESYLEAKLKLFNMVNDSAANYTIVNIDDANADCFIKASQAKVITYGINNDAMVRGLKVKTSLKGSSFIVKHQNGEFKINTKLIGLFSIYNILAAIAFALYAGIDPITIKNSLEKVEGVPGRFEQINCGQKFSVIVDYAHTPDGLENILKTAQEIVENRIITVFGCGGDRDKTKRPLMGKIAAKYSDFCVVTSDNPRSEEPHKIIEDIIPGLDEIEGSRYAIIIERQEAIHHAINLAKPGDVVIIAGKGHETYQLIGGKVLDFDDRQVARDFLRSQVK